MNISESKQFYDFDDKAYELIGNDIFLKIYYEEELDKEYSLPDMQQMLDFICYWYEAKYTERDLEYIEKYGIPDMKSMKRNVADRTIDNFFELLSDKMSYFLLADNSKTKKYMLQLAALKILYSERSTPERGYERSKIYINEFNKSIVNLELDSKEIDSIMSRNYVKSGNVERVKINNLSFEEFTKLPIKDAEKLVRVENKRTLNMIANANYDSNGKVKVMLKRLFRKKK